jgi:5-carboxyvanillate decarboxylase
MTQQTPATPRTGGGNGYLRIATEEAYALPEMFDLYRRQLADKSNDDIGFNSLLGYFLGSKHPQPQSVVERLQDAGERRLRDMDAAGIDHQVMALTAPGTQVLDAADARNIAALSNDRLAEACAAHPDRFSALAAVAFQEPGSAAKELRRAIGDLGLKGLILNSHIQGEYIDNPKFLPVLEELNDLGAPLYLHPSTPSNRMIEPLHEAGLDGAVYGFGVETGMHLLRIITSGLLDRFPDLKVVVGHLGEALPFWLHRIDHMHAKQVAAGRYEAIKPLELKPSEYFRRNIWITTSGMPWEPAIMFTREVVGADRVMYAMDYPYQYEIQEVIDQDNLPISLADKKRFFEGTARNVFNLDF